NFPYVQPTADLHPRALLLLECASLVGAHTGSVQPRLHLRKADTQELCNALPALDGTLAVLQPGARDPRRRWRAERFSKVGDALAGAGATVLIHGSQEEWK